LWVLTPFPIFFHLFLIRPGFDYMTATLTELCLEDCGHCDPVSVQLKISRLKSRLNSCDTQWLAYAVGYSDGTTESLIARNYCKSRSCNHSPCMNHRYLCELARFRVLLDACSFRGCDGQFSETVPFVTLTFGSHVELNSKVLTFMRRKFHNFMRRIDYKRKNHMKSVEIFEMKYEPHTGKYHCHIHAALERSPDMVTLGKIWSDVLGHYARTDVKYYAGKDHVARYFAKRVAFCGIGVPESDYVQFFAGRRFTSTHGICESVIKASLKARSDFNLVGARHNSTKKIVFITFIGTISKFRGETIPPPWEEWGCF